MVPLIDLGLTGRDTGVQKPHGVCTS